MTKIAQSLKAFQKDHKEAVGRPDGFNVDPRIIQVREDFNVRELAQMADMDVEEYEIYIDNLAKAYAEGRYVPPITVRVIDGNVYVSEGHTRHKGMMRAIEVYGADLKRVEVNEFKGSDLEEIALIATSQNNRKLKPLELARVYIRLQRQGWDVKEIAKHMGKTTTHVQQTITHGEMPAELQELVFLNKIAVIQAQELYDQHGSKAIEIAKAMISNAEKSGATKVTKKNAAPRMNRKETRSLNTATSSLYEAIRDVEADEGAETVTVTLTAELLAQLKELGAKAHEIENFDPASLLNEQEEGKAED